MVLRSSVPRGWLGVLLVEPPASLAFDRRLPAFPYVEPAPYATIARLPLGADSAIVY